MATDDDVKFAWDTEKHDAARPKPREVAEMSCKHCGGRLFLFLYAIDKVTENEVASFVDKFVSVVCGRCNKLQLVKDLVDARETAHLRVIEQSKAKA